MARAGTRLWRQGLWLGFAWGIVEVSILGGPARLPLTPILIEMMLAAVFWSGCGAVLGCVLGAKSSEAARQGPVILIGAFFAVSTNLLIHPFLLAGVGLLSPAGVLYAALFTAVLLVPVLIVGTRTRRSRSEATAPIGWVLAAVVMGGVFAVGRTVLVNWPPDLNRVWAALLLALAGECLVLVALRRRGKPALWEGRVGAWVGLVVLAAGLPLVLQKQPQALAEPTASGNAPPVILISLDTLRPDHVSAYGYARQTPNLDRFLSTCRMFPRAYATAPWTVPSHASVFTGLFPRAHGAHYRPASPPGEFPRPLDPNPRTLAEAFGEMGYLTAAISANRLAVSPELGLDRGFQTLNADRRLPDRPVPLNYVRSSARLLRLRWLWRLTVGHYDAADITDRVLDWLRPRAEKPFFLFVNYLDPHSPYAPPKQCFPGYDEMSAGERLRWHLRRIPKADVSLEAYDGEIAYLDGELGRLFRELQRLGLMDRAVIVVFSDHGEFFGELGLHGHGREVHEAVLRAVLGVRSPHGVYAGVDSTLASLADIPALIGACLEGQLPRPPGEGGPLVIGEKYLSRRDMGRAPRFKGASHLTAVRWGDFKLIEHTGEALFNLREDPLETTDLAPSNPAVMAKLEAILALWEQKTVPPEDGDTVTDKGLRETLRGLGYLN